MFPSYSSDIYQFLNNLEPFMLTVSAFHSIICMNTLDIVKISYTLLVI